MKRVKLGTKRKKAAPARKPVAKRPKNKKTTRPARSAAKKRTKRTTTRKTNATTQGKAATTKAVRKKKVARAAATKKSVVKTRAHVAPRVARPARKVTRPGLVPGRNKPSPAPKARNVRPPKLVVPAFLLEGDEPSHPDISGPGEKFSLGPTVQHEHFSEAIAPLPDSYGTGKLFLTARDPHWLYAHWDLPREEQFRHNARSVDRHLILRLYAAAKPESPATEVHVHPESKHWFIHVEYAGETYTTELGYYQSGRKWKSLSTSAPQRTPPDNISADSTVKFATIPAELSFETMLTLLKETAGEAGTQNTPLALVVDKIRPHAREHFPKTATASEWTPEQEQALAGVLAADQAGVALPGSEEFLAEKTGPEFSFNFETGEAAPLPAPTSYVSSFFGGAAQKDFWFTVNAELIIYGATEPNATVTFAGKQIQLRSDGSFRFRFALPDGQYELPVTAVSADGTDGRAAELKFTRATEIHGHVAAAPADPALRPPPTGSA